MFFIIRIRTISITHPFCVIQSAANDPQCETQDLGAVPVANAQGSLPTAEAPPVKRRGRKPKGKKVHSFFICHVHAHDFC